MCYDFISTRCKDCLKIERREYEEKNKEKFIAYRKKYRKARKLMAENPHLNVIVANAVISDTISTPSEQIQTTLEPTIETIQEPDLQDNNYELVFPDAYKELMEDDDAKYMFLNKRSEDYKIKYLEDKQEIFNRKKEDEERKEVNQKFREIAERAYRDPITNELNEKELDRIEDRMQEFSFKEDKKKFMISMSKFSYKTFAISRESVLENVI